MALFFPFYMFTVFHKFFKPLYSWAVLWILPVTVNCCLGLRNTNKFLLFEIILFPKIPVSAGTDSFWMESTLLHFLVLFLVLNFLEFFSGFFLHFHQKGLLFRPSYTFTLRVYFRLKSQLFLFLNHSLWERTFVSIYRLAFIVFYVNELL